MSAYLKSVIKSLSNEGLIDFSILKFDVPSKNITTFGLGEEVPVLLAPKSLKELIEVYKLLKTKSVPFKILGAGSNVILPDERIDFVILNITKSIQCFSYLESYLDLDKKSFLKELSLKNSFDFNFLEDKKSLYVLVSSGMPLIKLSKESTLNSLSGLEFCSGIPASLGGAIRMNAGAHGQSISSLVRKVFILDNNLEIKALSEEDLVFSYRNFKIEKDSLILASLLELKKGNREEIVSKRKSFLKYRRETQPLSYCSSGSVFKNPDNKNSAGKLLEDLGLKGYRKGGVCFSEKHANWLVKVDREAKARDARFLVDYARRKVLDEFNIDLKPEVKFW